MAFPPFSKRALSIPPYPEAKREKRGEKNFVRLSSNENPYGPSPGVAEAISRALTKLHRYPSSLMDRARSMLAERLNVTPENIIFGKGSNEIIELTCKVFLEEGDRVVVTKPCFPMYITYSLLSGAEIVEVPLSRYHIDVDGILRAMDGAKMVFLNSPMNPTGTLLDQDALTEIARKADGKAIVLMDEAYIDFAGEASSSSIELVKESFPLVVARSFSKSYGLAGLRVGFGIAQKDVISLMARVKQPYNLGIPEEAGIEAAILHSDHMERSVEAIVKERERMEGIFKDMGIPFVKSYANFILIILGDKAKDIYTELLKMGVYTRYMDSYGFPECIRVTVGRPEENEFFLSSLKKALKKVGGLQWP